MRYLGFAALAVAVLCSTAPAKAQGATAKVVASCGSAQGVAVGRQGALTEDTTGTLCTSGSGGGGGGAVTLAAGAVAAGAYVAGSVLDGAIVTIGALADAAWTSGNGSVIAILKNIATAAATTNTNLGALADAACGTDNGSCDLIALVKRTNQNITTLNTTASGAVAAGTNLIGYFGGDGTAGVPTTHILTVQPPTSNLISGVTAAMTGTTSTSVIALVSSKKLFITHVSCVNSHATVGTFVNFQDGSGGTTLWTVGAAAVYGGEVDNGGNIPLFSTSSGVALFAADVTTGANVICKASGFSGTP